MSEPLNAEKLSGLLRTARAGRSLIFRGETESTNALAKQAARDGAEHGTLVLCEKQTAGRGRRGRTWQAQPGEALTFSLILKPELPPERLPLCTPACAMALCGALESLGLNGCGIKWPNDAVVNGKKLAGILCENVTDTEGRTAVIAGVGLNVSQKAFPPDIADTAASVLTAWGAAPERETLLAAWLYEAERTAELLQKDPEAFLSEYRRRCITLGRAVRVLEPAAEWTGTAEDIEESGALRVRADSGEMRCVLCGDVSVRGISGYCG